VKACEKPPANSKFRESSKTQAKKKAHDKALDEIIQTKA